MVKVKIIPLNKAIKVKPGSNLGTTLQNFGLELPCGGYGTCGKCQIRVIEGDLKVKASDKKYISVDRLEKGWRLACQHTVHDDLTVEVQQWELEPINHSDSIPIIDGGSYGIAIDAGSTTIAGQLVDLDNGNILKTEVTYNSQKSYGADIMTRISFALEKDAAAMRNKLIESIERVVHKLSLNITGRIEKIHIVGNTFIHHSFGGLNLESLVKIPYQASSLEAYTTNSQELGWQIQDNPAITFLPNLGGYVGSDILAGILSTAMHKQKAATLLLDIGTNGEMVLGNEDKLYFTSTAAGPAFEGGKISQGMRADQGAILHVYCRNNKLSVEIKNSTEPKGICGSGLLDAVACGLDLKKVEPSGRIVNESKTMMIQEPVKILQDDIRELQLAKGAIAAGIEVLLQKAELQIEDLDKIYLAGAFGNYMRVSSAVRIGLLNTGQEKIESSGNTALHGAVLSLFNENLDPILHIAEKIDLKMVSKFQQLYIKNMNFPK